MSKLLDEWKISYEQTICHTIRFKVRFGRISYIAQGPCFPTQESRLEIAYILLSLLCSRTYLVISRHDSGNHMWNYVFLIGVQFHLTNEFFILHVQSISKKIFTRFTLCCGLLSFGTCQFYPYASGFSHWHRNIVRIRKSQISDFAKIW